jgi:transcriptional regulator with XRE-family HTH domain
VSSAAVAFLALARRAQDAKQRADALKRAAHGALRPARRSVGLPLRVVAERTGLTQGALSNAERGELGAGFSAATLVRIGEVLVAEVVATPDDVA